MMDEQARSADDKGILDTVRRILSEDQVRAPEPNRRPTRAAPPGAEEDVFQLEPAMMIDPAPTPATPSERPADARRAAEPAPDPTPATTEPTLVRGPAEQATRGAVGSLRAAMRDQRVLQTHRGGPTLDEIVREEMRPLLAEWLDANLPPLVERLVRAEIARIVESGI